MDIRILLGTQERSIQPSLRQEETMFPKMLPFDWVMKDERELAKGRKNEGSSGRGSTIESNHTEMASLWLGQKGILPCSFSRKGHRGISVR